MTMTADPIRYASPARTIPTTTMPATAVAIPTSPAPPGRAGNGESAPSPQRAPVKSNRISYLSWGAAYLVGWGSFALSKGNDPVLSMPSIVPTLLLLVGLIGATIATTVTSVRATKGLTGSDATPGHMMGAAWAIGFTALFLLITALAGDIGVHRIETLLWPAGSGLVVGLLYLMGGALDRDPLQYCLGVWLALVTTAAVFLGTPGMYFVLATAAGGAYFIAAYLELRRVAASTRAASI